MFLFCFEVELLFHALICLYLRKVEKKEQLPKDDATKEICEELSGKLFKNFDDKPTVRAKAMTKVTTHKFFFPLGFKNSQLFRSQKYFREDVFNLFVIKS